MVKNCLVLRMTLEGMVSLGVCVVRQASVIV